MNIKFEPISKHSQDDFNILLNGKVIGMFYWHKCLGNNGSIKTALVKNLDGNICICANEEQAIKWLLKTIPLSDQ